MSIVVENLHYIYEKGTPFETYALKNINFEIKQGEFIGLIGHTGSGKSTLIQNLNGLLTPNEGKIYIDGVDLLNEKVKKSEIRKKVGLVFQYPEYQLFEETVFKDVAFGPSNLKLSKEEVHKRVKDSIELVGLDFDQVKDKSPFELSGGQKRRVAIAGVLAMEPKIIILDEPTAGLDPKGRDEILDQIKQLNKARNITVILVSHSMEDIARLVEKVIVMDQGQIKLVGNAKEVFMQSDILESIGLGVPQISKLVNLLNKQGCDFDHSITTIEEAEEAIFKRIKGDKNA